MGRELTTKEDALPKAIAKFLREESDKYIKKKLGKSKTTRHRVGK